MVIAVFLLICAVAAGGAYLLLRITGRPDDKDDQWPR